ncbi:MAG: DJ-1/PfpI family protein [Muribaculaceae bacterium]|nr:DJ-1/PfpI family protein [Muribaculaceae bacterium]
MNYVFFADGFEEIEALATVDVMRRAGMDVTLVSINATTQVTGAHGVKVEADALMEDVDAEQAEWLVLPGGMPGATNLMACEPLTSMLVAHHKAGGKVAAICASPAIVFAPLGILEGRNATCYPGMEAEGCGVNWQNDMVVVDGNVVTGRGPAAACSFGFTIAAMSQGIDQAEAVAQGMLLK